jgi:hypothetical protein
VELQQLELIEASVFRRQAAPDWSHCRWRLLAEGDSWFSLGSLNPLTSANLLQSMAFTSFAAAVHCSYPGDTLRRMAEFRNDPNFEQLLAGNVSWRWDAILLSAGGNDLIEATGAPPDSAPGMRLLRTQPEWGDPALGAARYLNAEGWQTFSSYFRANLDAIVGLRDRKRGSNGNLGRPLCLHTYAYPTPRPSGAGAGQGPWLMPSLQMYGIPEGDWPGVAHELLDQLANLMLACAADKTRYPALHVFDTRRLAIDPAAPGSGGISGDWLNEIHLTAAGCRKVALPWCAEIEKVMVANP